MSLGGSYQCSNCGRELKEKEFMAVIGNTPATGLSAPLGRADVILDEVGQIYCEPCFKERYKRSENSSLETNRPQS